METPLSHGVVKNNSDIKGELEAIAKANGYTSFVLVGRKIDHEKKSISLEYKPFGCDLIEQIGLLEYAKVVAQHHVIYGTPDKDSIRKPVLTNDKA